MTAEVLAQVVRDVLRDPVAHQEPESGLPPLWGLVRELGWPAVGIAEDDGGEGGTLAELCAVVRLLGGHPVGVPLAEAALARWVAARAGLAGQLGDGQLGDGQLGDGLPVPVLPGADEQVRTGAGSLTGTVARVPWASLAHRLVVVAGRTAVVVEPAEVAMHPGTNLAREPRDTVRLTGARVVAAAPGPGLAEVRCRAALLRCAGLVGALERVAELTAAHVDTRTQFGRPLRAFQAVGHSVATIACERELARAALAAAEQEPLDPRRVAAARVVAGRAATTASRLAHQLHGAIGVTREHELHRYTGRLLAWRDEAGTQREWTRELGRAVCAGGSGGMWQWLTSRQGGG